MVGGRQAGGYIFYVCVHVCTLLYLHVISDMYSIIYMIFKLYMFFASFKSLCKRNCFSWPISTVVDILFALVFHNVFITHERFESGALNGSIPSVISDALLVRVVSFCLFCKIASLSNRSASFCGVLFFRVYVVLRSFNRAFEANVCSYRCKNK